MNEKNQIAEFAGRVRKNIEKVFLGKTNVVDMLITAFLSRGHVLLEDVPGTGKTILAKAFAASIDLSYARIQCTSDLLPADILGVSVWHPADEFDDKKGRFIYSPGPLLNQFVLIDEINRAAPRTQSALLEAMAETQITIDNNRICLPDPFFVIATENPIEFEGTFPLPEAQKDRFLLTLNIGYPNTEIESQILENQRRITHPVFDLKPVASTQEISALQDAVSAVHVDKAVKNYLLALVCASRSNYQLRNGISPRGSLALYRCAQAYAGIQNRDFVTPEDIKEMAKYVFKQRLLLTSDAFIRGITSDRIIDSIVDSTPIPEYRNS